MQNAQGSVGMVWQSLPLTAVACEASVKLQPATSESTPFGLVWGSRRREQAGSSPAQRRSSSRLSFAVPPSPDKSCCIRQAEVWAGQQQQRRGPLPSPPLPWLEAGGMNYCVLLHCLPPPAIHHHLCFVASQQPYRRARVSGAKSPCGCQTGADLWSA